LVTKLDWNQPLLIMLENAKNAYYTKIVVTTKQFM